ncbi:MAG: MBOAT family protein, partial [Oscillospiraceae bacterium]
DGYYAASFAIMFVIAIIASTPVFKNLFERLSDKSKAVLVPALIVLALVVSTAYLVDATYNPFLYFRF